MIISLTQYQLLSVFRSPLSVSNNYRPEGRPQLKFFDNKNADADTASKCMLKNRKPMIDSSGIS